MASALNCYCCVVELKSIDIVAMLNRERCSERDRRVAAEWNLEFRRKISDTPTISEGHSEGGLRIANIGCDPLHLHRFWHFVGQYNTRRIATNIAIRKCRKSTYVQLSSVSR